MIHLTPADFVGSYRLDFNLDPVTHQDAIRTIENLILHDIFYDDFGRNFIFLGAPNIVNSFAINMRTYLHCPVAYQDFMVPLVLSKYISSISPVGVPKKTEFDKVFYPVAATINKFLRFVSYAEGLHRTLITDAAGVGRHIMQRLNLIDGRYLPFPVPEGTQFVDSANNVYTVNTVIYTPTELQYTFLPAAPPNDSLTNITYLRILKRYVYNVV
ncbi:MAG: hypothetical protein D6735_04135 [Acidobacteria bacterium]|nr:MAG: hypothetical protein D6735_04135 [Acidobacteriota bacterium]